MLRPLFKTSITKDLKISQAEANTQTPQSKNCAESVQSAIRDGVGRVQEILNFSVERRAPPPGRTGEDARLSTKIIAGAPWKLRLRGDFVLNYLADITEIGVTLARIGDAESGSVVSMRITWPACGDCRPIFLAKTSMRCGS